jgi:hypothetical protein
MVEFSKIGVVCAGWDVLAKSFENARDELSRRGQGGLDLSEKWRVVLASLRTSQCPDPHAASLESSSRSGISQNHLMRPHTSRIEKSCHVRVWTRPEAGRDKHRVLRRGKRTRQSGKGKYRERLTGAAPKAQGHVRSRSGSVITTERTPRGVSDDLIQLV